MRNRPATRVLLADDHEMVRAALRAVLEAEPGLEVVAEAADGPAAVELARRLRPDVLVTDQRMPGLSGTEVARRAIADNPAVKVLILSARSDPWLAEESASAGAAGCVAKDYAFEELAAAVRVTAAGGVYRSPRLAGSTGAEGSAPPSGG